MILDAVFRHGIALELKKSAGTKRFHSLFEKVAAHPHWSFDHHDAACRHEALLFMKWLLEDLNSRISGIQSIVDIRAAIKYSCTAEVTWAHAYFHTRTSAKDRYARSLVNPA